MSKGIRRKPRSKRRSTSPVLVACLVGGGLLLTIGVVLVILFASGKINPLGARTALGLPNNRVNEDNYTALKQGATLAEVEAILGQGRAPTAGDFDAICGTEVERFTNPFFGDRKLWEYHSGQGQILLWINGQVRPICLAI